MNEPTQLIVSIQGKRGSGKSVLAAHVLEPVMALIGAKLDNKTDKSSGVFLTYQVPFGFAELPLETFTRDQVEKIVLDAITKDRAQDGPHLSFATAPELTELLRCRAVLEDFLLGEHDEDIATSTAVQMLPPNLRKVLEPKSVIRLLRQDARLQIEQIDLKLEQLGFDTSDRAELPAV